MATIIIIALFISLLVATVTIWCIGNKNDSLLLTFGFFLIASPIVSTIMVAGIYGLGQMIMAAIRG